MNRSAGWDERAQFCWSTLMDEHCGHRNAGN
jgi:hypothetical protein